MSWHQHPDATDVVREHWHEAECFLVAARPTCIDIRDDEVGAIDRLLHGGSPDDLDAWIRPASWFVAVLLCPGDDTAALVRATERLGLDARRFHFYLHAEASFDALRAWADAGLPLDRVDDAGPGGTPITDWKALHRLLGLHFNVQILADFT